MGSNFSTFIPTDVFCGYEFLLKSNDNRVSGTVEAANFNIEDGRIYFSIRLETGETVEVKALDTIVFDKGWFRNYEFRKNDIIKEQNRLAELHRLQVEAEKIEQERARRAAEEQKRLEEARKMQLQKEAEEQSRLEEARKIQLQKGAEAQRLEQMAEQKRLEEAKKIQMQKETELAKKAEEQRRQAKEAEKNKLREMRRNFQQPEVHNIHSYYPIRSWKEIGDNYPEDVSISKRILAYKKANLKEVEAFSEDFLLKVYSVVKNFEKCDRVVIIPVPCSRVSAIPATKYTTEMIVRSFNESRIFPEIRFINGYGFITRKYDIASAHNSAPNERPDCMENFDSMECRTDVWQDQLTENTWYILLDDIMTRGLQMKACMYRLVYSGIPNNKMCGIVLGKTEKVY